MKLRELVLGAMLAAMALMIPLYFGFARFVIPPAYSATLASHVPIMVAIFISPLAAAVAALGSGLGFLMALGPIIGARAFTHVIWAVLGAFLYRRGMAPVWVLGVILPVHALAEAAVILPFGISLREALLITGIGTAIHHIADSLITLAVIMPLAAAGLAFSEMRRRGTGGPRVK